MRCKTKQREDSRSVHSETFSELILGYRRTTADASSLRPAPVLRAKMSIFAASLAKLGLEDK
jgi:hypothetical protein